MIHIILKSATNRIKGGCLQIERCLFLIDLYILRIYTKLLKTNEL